VSEPTDPAAPSGSADPKAKANPTKAIEDRLDDAEAAMSQAQLDELLSKTVAPPPVKKTAAPAPFQLNDLQSNESDAPPHSLDLLSDVELDLRIELGRTQMKLEDVLHLRGGSVVALDKLAGDPVDVFVNGRLIAHGEVLVMNDNFCIRVTELVGAPPL
jgi:flagellar motor switch protein FliN/FliY